MSEKRKPKKSLLVRLDDEQYACIINYARQRDMTTNSLVRECLAGALSPSDTYQRIKPVKAYSPRTPPKPEYIKELYRLRESTAELCGALVQYAIKTRQNGHVMAHEEAEKLIPDVRQAVLNLDTLRRKLERHG